MRCSRFLSYPYTQRFSYGLKCTKVIAINNTGKVGIGITPSFKLDVVDDINVTPSAANQGYRIGGIRVLATNGNGNLFVGENA